MHAWRRLAGEEGYHVDALVRSDLLHEGDDDGPLGGLAEALHVLDLRGEDHGLGPHLLLLLRMAEGDGWVQCLDGWRGGGEGQSRGEDGGGPCTSWAAAWGATADWAMAFEGAREMEMAAPRAAAYFLKLSRRPIVGRDSWSLGFGVRLFESNGGDEDPL